MSFMQALHVDLCNEATVLPRSQVLGEDLPISAHDIKIMVNWMHGASHDMSCQLRNNGRFQEGARSVVGEQAEQLWSMIRVRYC